MKRIYSLLLLLLVFVSLQAQELNCVIDIDYSLVETQESQIFTELKANIYDFMNNRTWTDDEFEVEERIKCYITIQLNKDTDIAKGYFSATARINAVRPVYGVDYETSVLDFVDQKFNFSYNQSSNLNYSENTYSGGLSSLLSFYAYLFLGYDYDTFSELGGAIYFDKARDIMNITQSSDSGNDSWNSKGDKTNRYYLVDDITSNQMEGVRKVYYSYHRLGLDQLSKKRTESQKIVLEGLKEIEKMRNLNPISIYLTTFFNCKKNELVSIFKAARPEVKAEAEKLLTSSDPTNTKIYSSLSEL